MTSSVSFGEKRLISTQLSRGPLLVAFSANVCGTPGLLRLNWVEIFFPGPQA